MIRRRRARLAALVTSALLGTAALACAAGPAQASTFDGRPVHFTARFTVAGHRYSLRDVSVGGSTQTVRVGQHSGQVHSRYRLTLKNERGHVLKTATRNLEKQDFVLDALEDRSFSSVAAFRKAEHRAFTVTEAVAEASFMKELRLESVSADLESDVDVTLAYLDALPAGATPDFTAVQSIHSDEYRGDVTISGTDTRHWSVIVRDTQDGYGEFYDDATGSEAGFRF